ncbi:DsbA family protein [Actinomadura roseirufa]|uniref:DsbA family protein n=1 Tax=Actinomadura roseirufa TaxID=2094049 RepID=UPI0010417C5D|nr:thioredoxin domain-containing protein [Actinomadura roseirufa]
MGRAEGQHAARGPRAGDRTLAAARQRRRRALVVVLAAVAGAAVMVAVAVLALTRGGTGGGRVVVDYHGPLAPAVRQPDGSVAMAMPGVDSPVLELYEDFQCPACLALEVRQGATIKQLAAEGRAKVVYRPFQLFQQEPLMSNSRRAANAAACAPADRWVRYHDRIYSHQPDEGDVGFTNRQLVAWAGEVGVGGAEFARCVGRYERITTVDQATAHAGKAGVSATPFLTVDGRRVTGDALGSADGLRKAVGKAAKGAPGSRPPARTGAGQGHAAPGGGGEAALRPVP